MSTTIPLRELAQLGEPVARRGIVIAPLFPRRDPVAEYLGLDEALERGLTIEEASAAGSVPELSVVNPLKERVLLYDGEELVGAKQNRILNVSVLVDAKTTLPIPVSCVEEGRWRTTSRAFAAAPHAANPELRRRKAASLESAPLARGIAQGEVWDAVREKAARMSVDSETLANSDTFRAHRPRIEELEAAFPLQPGQCGAVLALGDELCLDWVSRPDTFERLWPKLRAGYLLDALERLDAKPASSLRIAAFLGALEGATATRRASAGLGEDLRLRAEGVVGSALELEGEPLQLSAFSAERGARVGRIARPSRRR
jgi:ARG/rhodanese/phosphatase superfamily protein